MKMSCDSQIGKTKTSNRGMAALMVGIAAGFAVLIGFYSAFLAK